MIDIIVFISFSAAFAFFGYALLEILQLNNDNK